MSKTYYITTAIDYVNSLPHIGTAYEKITADCIARAKRLLGYDVRFCMGTDEHSINVKKRAIEDGLTPREYCDGMVPQFEAIWRKLSITYDDFIRTTDDRHKTAVTELFRRIQAKGDIEIAHYNGWYCEGCEAFIQEKDLVDGKCANHMREPTWIEEQNYFFKLSRYAQPLLDLIHEDPDFIRPESRRNEIIRLIEGGLDDISVSRSGFDWGIPLPDDPDHVVYVWFDALINYISSLGFGGEDTTLMDKYWPADLHVIGKDITRFHCVIWPAMLMSGGVKPPKSVFGHGFIYHRGEKMSKSLGNVVSPLDVADKFGPDPLRYFLLREVVYGQDGDFTFERFVDRYNSDLANDLGNLVSRTISMIGKYFDGILPEDAELTEDGVTRGFDDVAGQWMDKIERYDLSGACDTAWDLIRAANRRIEVTAPWVLAKEGRTSELANVLYDLATVIGRAAVLLYPFVPSTADAMWTALKYPGDIMSLVDGDTISIPDIPAASKGVVIEKIPSLFPRIEQKKKEESVPDKDAKPEAPVTPDAAAAPEAPEAPAETATDDKDIIEYDDFLKLDLRVGTVTKAERKEGSKKLLRLSIDDGMGGRTILAGLAKHIAPEDVEGRQVVFVANLKPRKMMGEFSEGMVLAAGSDDILAVLNPAKPVKAGAKVS
jgi:methionyl-tRNA synthetase